MKKEMLARVPEEGQYYLADLVYPIIWPVMTHALLGEPFHAADFLHDFRIFDERSMLLASPIQLPYFLNSGARARERLMRRLRDFIEINYQDDFNGLTELIAGSLRIIKQYKLDGLEEARLLAAFLLGAQSNPARVAYWTLIYLLQDRSQYLSLRQKLVEFVDSVCHGDVSEITAASLSNLNLPLLDSAIYETMRLTTVPSSMRVAMEDFELTDHKGMSFSIARGDTILPSSELVHFDEQQYPDPHSFQIDRFMSEDKNSLKKDSNGQLATNNLLTWGGGKHMCKGRFVAIHELRAFLVGFIYLFDIEVIGVGKRGSVSPGIRVPGFDYNSIGTVLPTEDMLLKLKPRN